MKQAAALARLSGATPCLADAFGTASPWRASTACTVIVAPAVRQLFGWPL